MEDLGVARGYIDLDLGKMTSSIATAVSELQKIDQASRKTDSEIAVLQSTSQKTGSAFDEAAKQAASLSNRLEAAKSKVTVYEKEIATLKTQLTEGKAAQEQLAKTIEATKKKYDDAKTAVSELEKKYKSSKDALAAIKQTHEQNNAALQTAKKAMADYNSQMKAANKETKSYSNEVKKLEKEQAAVVKDQEKLNKQITKAQDAYIAEKKTIQELEKALDNAKKTRLEMIAAYGKESDEVKDAEAEIEKYEGKLSDANTALQKHAEEIRESKKALEDSKAQYTELGKSIDAAKTKYKEAGDAADKLADTQKSANDELKAAQDAYDKSAQAVKDAKDETKGYAQELDDAKNTARDYAREVSDLETKQRQLDNEMRTAGDRLEDFETDCNDAKTKVNELSIELANVKSKARVFGEFLEDAGGKLENFGGKVANIGGKLTTHITTPLVGVGTAAVKMAGDVETSAAKVATIADTTKVSLEELSEGVRKISDETGTSQSELNEGMYQWISATADTESALQGVAAANKLAVGGFTSTEDAVDLLTTILNTYGMALTDVDKISDELLATQNYGKTTVGQMAQSLGALVPTAAAAGISFEELQTDLAVLTRNGLSTDQAATALRAAITSMIEPSSDAANAAEILGVQWDAATLQSKGFAGMMGDLQKAIDNVQPKYIELSGQLNDVNAAMTANSDAMAANEARIEELKTQNTELTDARKAEAESAGRSSEYYKSLGDQIAANKDEIESLTDANKNLNEENKALKKSSDSLEEQLGILGDAAEAPITAFSELFGNIRGLTAALSVGNNLEDYATGFDVITNSAGATNKAFDIMQGTNATKLRKSLNRLKNTAIDAGEKIAPVVADIVDKVADIITKFSDLDEQEQKQILTFAGITAAAGPVLKVAGNVTSGIGGIVGGIGTFIKTVSTVKTTAGAAAAGIEGITGAADVASGALGAKGLSGVLSAIGAPEIGLAILAAGAIAGIAVACKYAHDEAIKNDLAEHFGNIKLSAEEVETIATRLTTRDWTVNLDAYMTAKGNLETLESEIQSTVDSLNEGDWKIKTGIGLDEDSKAKYKEDVGKFVEEVNTYAQEQHYAVNLAVKATGLEGTETANLMDQIMTQFETEADENGNAYKEFVEGMFVKNLFNDATTQQAVFEARQNLQNTLDKITKAEYDVDVSDIMDQLANGNLDPESQKALEAKLSELLTKRKQEIEDASRQQKVTLRYGLNEGIIDQDQFDAAVAELERSADQQLGELYLDNINLEIGGITAAYDGASLSKAEGIMKQVSDLFDNTMKNIGSGEMTGFLGRKLGEQSEVSAKTIFANFERIVDYYNSTLTPIEKSAVAQMLKAMEPQKEDLEEIEARYIEAGEAVPDSITEGLQNYYKLEAMTGNIDAMYKLLAYQIAESPEKQQAILEANETTGVLTGLFANADFNEALKEKAPEFYNTVQSVVENSEALAEQGGKSLTQIARQTVRDVDNTVNTATPAVIPITTDPASKILGGLMDKVRSLLSRIKINLPINFGTGGFNSLRGYSSGGIVSQAQVATIAEGNKPEAVIPLDASQRSNALQLWQQVGSMIGAEGALYGNKSGNSGGDLADRIANKLEAVFRAAPVQTNVEMAMEDGAVYMDSDIVGRKVAPTVSRIQAKRL